MKPPHTRPPVAVLALTVATAGIYAVLWLYRVNRDLMAAGAPTWAVGARIRDAILLGAAGWIAAAGLLAPAGVANTAGFVLLGLCLAGSGAVVTYAIFRTATSIRTVQRVRGLEGANPIPLFLTLLLLPLVGLPWAQHEVNRAARAS